MNAFASLPSACLDLEMPIRDVTYMAGIARDLAWDLLNGETPKTDGADVIIRMSNWQHDQLLFAIERSTTWPWISKRPITAGPSQRRVVEHENQRGGFRVAPFHLGVSREFHCSRRFD
jgi:hypothetical protein